MIDLVPQLTVRLGLALLFATAAWHKLADGARFAGTVHAYRLLPARFQGPIALSLPLIEIAIAIGLLYSPTFPMAAVAAVALLTLYTFAISVNLARGRRNFDCGCLANSATVPLSGSLVARNLLLIAAACALLLPTRSRTLVWVDALTVIAALGTLTLLWIAGQRLAQSGPALRKARGGAR